MFVEVQPTRVQGRRGRGGAWGLGERVSGLLQAGLGTALIRIERWLDLATWGHW